MLSDLATLATFLRVTDTTQDANLIPLLSAADAAVKTYCKRNFENQVYTEYPKTQGTPTIWLRQRPVLCFATTGNLTNGLATITNIPAAAAIQTNLFAGMPVTINGAQLSSSAVVPIPNATTIVSVDSASQVTMSANATAGGTAVGLCFGLSVWLDAGGYFGDGISPFSSQTQLFIGNAYALQRDRPDGQTSISGVLLRLGGGILGSVLDWPTLQRRGSLTAVVPPVWPQGYGIVKVQYAAGYGVGAAAPPSRSNNLPAGTTIPADLTLAVNQLVGWFRATAPVGIPLESGGEYTQALAEVMMKGLNEQAPMLGTTLYTLSRYREQAF